MAYRSVLFNASGADEAVYLLLCRAGQPLNRDIALAVHRDAQRRGGLSKWVAYESSSGALVRLDVEARMPGAFKLSVTIDDPRGVQILDRWLAQVQAHIIKVIV